MVLMTAAAGASVLFVSLPKRSCYGGRGMGLERGVGAAKGDGTGGEGRKRSVLEVGVEVGVVVKGEIVVGDGSGEKAVALGGGGLMRLGEEGGGFED